MYEIYLQKDVDKIMGTYHEAQLLLQQGKNIDEAGKVVERELRRLIRHRYPSYYVGQGHIVDGTYRSHQIDVLIGEQARISFRARGDTDDDAAFIDYPGVDAIGAVRITYDRKDDIEGFLNVLRELKSKVQSRRPSWRPLFSFMFFVKSNPHTELLVRHIKDLYASKPASEIPNVVCFLDKGLVVQEVSVFKFEPMVNARPASGMIGARYRWVLYSYGQDESGAGNLGALFEILGKHLEYSREERTNMALLKPDFALRERHMLTQEYPFMIRRSEPVDESDQS